MITDQLTTDELSALVRFSQVHGRRWKQSLRLDWMNATASGVTSDERSTLIALRNKDVARRIANVTTLALTTALAKRKACDIVTAELRRRAGDCKGTLASIGIECRVFADGPRPAIVISVQECERMFDHFRNAISSAAQQGES